MSFRAALRDFLAPLMPPTEMRFENRCSSTIVTLLVRRVTATELPLNLCALTGNIAPNCDLHIPFEPGCYDIAAQAEDGRTFSLYARDLKSFRTLPIRFTN